MGSVEALDNFPSQTDDLEEDLELEPIQWLFQAILRHFGWVGLLSTIFGHLLPFSTVLIHFGALSDQSLGHFGSHYLPHTVILQPNTAKISKKWSIMTQDGQNMTKISLKNSCLCPKIMPNEPKNVSKNPK